MWDAENRLTQAVTTPAAINAGVPDLRLTFGYDAQGRRVSKKVEKRAGATSSWEVLRDIRFIYEGWNLVAEVELRLTAYDAPAPGGRPHLLRSYTWGPDLSGSLTGAGGVGGLLCLTRHERGVSPADSYWATSDLNGNVIGLSAVSTVRHALYEYNAFGSPVRVNEPEPELNPMRFSSKYTDVETNWLYYGYRYYNPELGRWLSRDPIGERGGNNLYGMCGNDAVNSWDYLGLYLLEVNRDTKLLVKSLGGGAISEQWMSLGQISEYLRSQCCKSISIKAEGKVMIDTDGTGPSHGDPDQQNETSYKPGGASLNADNTAYAVAPRIMSYDSGYGESILRPGDKATISANGESISAVVGDFGPNKIAGSENTSSEKSRIKRFRTWASRSRSPKGMALLWESMT